MMRLPPLTRMACLALFVVGLTAGAMAQTVPKDDPPSAPAAGCEVVDGPFRFCGSAPEFALTPQGDNPAVTAYYATPEGIQAIVIVEALGRLDGLTIALLQDAALQILSEASGQEISRIPVLSRSVFTIDGRDAPNFVYRGEVDGTSIIYSNSIVLTEHAVAQFVTLDVGATTLTPRHAALHNRFIAQMRVAR